MRGQAFAGYASALFKIVHKQQQFSFAQFVVEFVSMQHDVYNLDEKINDTRIKIFLLKV